MSILEELKKKLSDIEIQNLAMEGCSPTFTVSDIMDLIDSVELAQNLPNACTDTISRQAAVDVVDFECGEWRGLAKTITDKLEALPTVQPDHTADIGKKVCVDTISRQAAIDAVEKESQVDGAYGYMDTKSIVDLLNALPPAQPEHPKGKWIVYYECPKCGEITKDFTEYCPFCGADMRGEQDDS